MEKRIESPVYHFCGLFGNVFSPCGSSEVRQCNFRSASVSEMVCKGACTSLFDTCLLHRRCYWCVCETGFGHDAEQ